MLCRKNRAVVVVMVKWQSRRRKDLISWGKEKRKEKKGEKIKKKNLIYLYYMLWSACCHCSTNIYIIINL
jgi:hypothetical protein